MKVMTHHLPAAVRLGLAVCIPLLFSSPSRAETPRKPLLDSLLAISLSPGFPPNPRNWDFRTNSPWQSADIQIHQGNPTNSSVLAMSGATSPPHLEVMYAWNVPSEGFRIFCVLDLLGRPYQAEAVQKIITAYDKDFQADVLQFSSLKTWEEMARYQAGQRDKLQTMLSEHWDSAGAEGKCPQLYSVAIIMRERQ